MSTAVNPTRAAQTKAPESFIDKHFAALAFTISTLALLILSPLHLLIGTVIGLVINYYMDPNLRLKSTDKVITIPNAVFAIVGATAAILRMTPAGALGGFIFQAVPIVASVAGIGSTAYRAGKSL